jgi:hypothetical protein
MQLTTNQILTLARAKLLEQTTENLADATLLLYANLTQDDIKKRTFTNDKIQSAAVSFSSGVGTLPATFGTLYGDPFDSSNNFYKEVSIDDFNKQIAQYAVTIDSGTIKVFPTTTSSLTIRFYPVFSTMTSVVNPTVNDYFHELIIYGILYRAYEDLQDEALSKYYREKYEAELTQKIEIQSNYEEGNQRGGEMFSYQQLI